MKAKCFGATSQLLMWYQSQLPTFGSFFFVCTRVTVTPSRFTKTLTRFFFVSSFQSARGGGERAAARGRAARGGAPLPECHSARNVPGSGCSSAFTPHSSPSSSAMAGPPGRPRRRSAQAPRARGRPSPSSALSLQVCSTAALAHRSTPCLSLCWPATCLLAQPGHQSGVLDLQWSYLTSGVTTSLPPLVCHGGRRAQANEESSAGDGAGVVRLGAGSFPVALRPRLAATPSRAPRRRHLAASARGPAIRYGTCSLGPTGC